MKIVLIGGGSVQWTLVLVADMALTPALADAQVVLHDIDAGALTLLKGASRQIVARLNGRLRIDDSADLDHALRRADFVILCVGIGGLAAMRHDLEVPSYYGVHQSVGDTVGPGGLSRALRHIPFAVDVARRMERLCPKAWLLNLTNPMTTICAAVTQATSIACIGLCHEVTGVWRRLAHLLGVALEQIAFRVAGINHLPALLDLAVDGRDGTALLSAWLRDHSALDFVHRHHSDPLVDVFTDRLAVKLTLFEETGILYGAGDRHVAEFFARFLTEEADLGRRYGVVPTTIQHREALLARRQQTVRQIADGHDVEWQRSGEQLAAVIAALGGGPGELFVVNVPNRGQIANLPAQAVVECQVQIQAGQLWPLPAMTLPAEAHEVIAPHLARQALIVKAALEKDRRFALFALKNDPLLRDPTTAAPMLESLWQANQPWMI